MPRLLREQVQQGIEERRTDQNLEHEIAADIADKTEVFQIMYDPAQPQNARYRKWTRLEIEHPEQSGYRTNDGHDREVELVYSEKEAEEIIADLKRGK